VRDAADADSIVFVRCLSCRHVRQIHAFSIARRLKGIDVALDEPQRGFRCTRCRRSVEVMITCPLQ
jgi:hypothetical protein